VQGKNTILLSETWENEANLASYLRSDEYRNILLVLEMAVKEPEIRFDTVSGSTGIETVQKARRSHS
jgi:quinol monooxygenase YgiN